MSDLPRLLSAFPDKLRIYAIADIHGCDGALAELHRQIDDDGPRGEAARTVEIVLGDMIDRGPDSRGVVDRLLRRRAGGREVRVLTGNHEAMMLDALRDRARLARWLEQGGGETLRSYGVTPPSGPSGGDAADCIERLHAAMPQAHGAFYAALERAIDLAGFVFVHAGLRPGIPFEAQAPDDLIWIREPFLSHDRPLDRFVVHGHTPGERVELRPHRIGLDTGAYRSGRLSCLMIERGRMRLTDSRSGWIDLA